MKFGEYDRRVWILFIGRVISATGFSVVMPFLGLYLYSERNVPMSMVGSIFTFSLIAGAISQIIGGEWTDRFGRKKIMVFAMMSRAFIFIFISYFVGINANFFVLAFIFMISSFFGHLFEPASSAMIADVVPLERRTSAYGILRVGMNFGWALGPAIGGILASVSYSSLFLLTSISSFLTGILVLLFVKESHHTSIQKFNLSEAMNVIRDKNFLFFCFISLMLFIVMGQLITTVSVYGVEHVKISKIQVGYLYMINGLFVVIFQFPIARILERIKMTNALIFGSFFYAIGYFAMGGASSFLLMALCILGVTLGEVIVSPSGMALVANMSPEENRGRYMGVYGVSNSLGWAIAPVLGGAILDVTIEKPFLMWGSISSVAVLTGFGYYALGNRLSEKANRASIT